MPPIWCKQINWQKEKEIGTVIMMYHHDHIGWYTGKCIGYDHIDDQKYEFRFKEDGARGSYTINNLKRDIKAGVLYVLHRAPKAEAAEALDA